MAGQSARGVYYTVTAARSVGSLLMAVMAAMATQWGLSSGPLVGPTHCLAPLRRSALWPRGMTSTGLQAAVRSNDATRLYRANCYQHRRRASCYRVTAAVCLFKWLLRNSAKTVKEVICNPITTRQRHKHARKKLLASSP